MFHRRKLRVVAPPAAATVALTLFGCSSPVVNMHSRNRVETLAVVNNGRSIAAGNVVFALELQDTREEIGLRDIDRFLAWREAGRVSQALRSEMLAKKEKVDATLTAAGTLYRVENLSDPLVRRAFECLREKRVISLR
ncbi:MAG: hypothetical protein ACE5EO_04090 [Candidatus Krumholzibacteriia bacterium]